jgi:hypothetical protein
MKNKTTFRFILLLSISLLFTALTRGQAAQTPSTKSEFAARVGTYLLKSPYEFKILSDKYWIINHKTGGTILLAVEEDLMVMGVVVAKQGDYRVTAESMSDMLKLAHQLDFIKVGIDDDGDLFVRMERRGKTLEQKEFFDFVETVASASVKAGKQIGPYMIRR